MLMSAVVSDKGCYQIICFTSENPPLSLMSEENVKMWEYGVNYSIHR